MDPLWCLGSTKVFHNHWNLLWSFSGDHFSRIERINWWFNRQINETHLDTELVFFFSGLKKHLHQWLWSVLPHLHCWSLILNINWSIQRLNCLSLLAVRKIVLQRRNRISLGTFIKARRISLNGFFSTERIFSTSSVSSLHFPRRIFTLISFRTEFESFHYWSTTVFHESFDHTVEIWSSLFIFNRDKFQCAEFCHQSTASEWFLFNSTREWNNVDTLLYFLPRLVRWKWNQRLFFICSVEWFNSRIDDRFFFGVGVRRLFPVEWRSSIDDHNSRSTRLLDGMDKSFSIDCQSWLKCFRWSSSIFKWILHIESFPSSLVDSESKSCWTNSFVSLATTQSTRSKQSSKGHFEFVLHLIFFFLNLYLDSRWRDPGHQYFHLFVRRTTLFERLFVIECFCFGRIPKRIESSSESSWISNWISRWSSVEQLELEHNSNSIDNSRSTHSIDSSTFSISSRIKSTLRFCRIEIDRLDCRDWLRVDVFVWRLHCFRWHLEFLAKIFKCRRINSFNVRRIFWRSVSLLFETDL